MVNLIFTELIKGEENLQEYFKKAKEHWIDMVSSPNFLDEEKFAHTLHIEQSYFENNCGGKTLGKIIFAIVGIGLFYDYHIGLNGDNKKEARKIVKVFQNSACSQEVKFTSEEVAKIYDLN